MKLKINTSDQVLEPPFKVDMVALVTEQTTTTKKSTHMQSERGPADGVLLLSAVHLLSRCQCVSAGDEHFRDVMMSWEKLTHTRARR